MLSLKPNLVPNLKTRSSSFWCSLTYSLYHLCASLKLNTSWIQTSINHMAQSLIAGYATLCTPWISNLGCKPWFANKGVYWVDECIVLLYVNYAMAKSSNQLYWWWLVVHHKYCSNTWLICSVYPSVQGWKDDENFTFTPKSSKNCF
jgi:hypothetical protein